MICRTCNIDKDVSQFYPSQAGTKGRCRCKDCCKIYQAEYKLKHPEQVRMWTRKRMRKWRENNPELNCERSQEQSVKHRERNNSYSRKYSKNNRDKKRAQLIAYYAVKTGKLIPQPCEVCGNPRVEKHHDDYSKPLEVRWLCSMHHHRHHKWLEDSLVSQSA